MSDRETLANLPVEQQRQMLRKLLEERAGGGGGRFPMSVQQQSLWHEYLQDPSSPSFNVFLPARIRSSIDVPRFRRAIENLVARHAALRTTFGNDAGKPFQQTHEALPAGFRVLDASGYSEAQLREAVIEESVQPFDLRSGPLLRLALFQKSPEDWVVIATAHHIVVDFWSLVLLLGEMRQLYEDSNSAIRNELAPRADNYDAFVRQQAELLGSPDGDRLRRYWRRQLRGASLVTEFPTDFFRPARFTGRAATVPIDFSPQTVKRMSKVAADLGVTFPSLMLAIVSVLIHRYTGQESFLIGTPFSGRLHRKFEETVGFFVNMLPLRADVTDELCFADVVRRTSQAFADALQNEALPLAEIVRQSAAPRDPSRSPMFQISCTFEKSHRRQESGRAGYLFDGDLQRTNFGGMVQESYPIPIQSCHQDLEFIFERSDDGIHAMLCYCRDLFAPSSMEQLSGNLCQLADQLLRHPSRPLSDVPWSRAGKYPKQDRSRSHGVESAKPNDDSVFLAIERIARTHPEQVALSCGPYQRTYRQLVDEADRIAAALTRRGIGSGCYVPVIGRRGPFVVPALLGVLAAGAAIVPIDANEPAVEFPDLVADTEAACLIVDEEETRGLVSERIASSVEVCTIDRLLGEGVNNARTGDDGSIRREVWHVPAPHDLCYLIYTSGSSGRPKGVMIEHQSIQNTLQWRCEAVPVTPDDRILILLSHQFDAGLGLLLSSLIQGARLVWPDAKASNVDAMLDMIGQESITILPTIPSLLALIVEHPDFGKCESVRQVWTGGETMPSDLPQRLRSKRSIPFWNFYGPTEAAIEASAAEVSGHPANRLVPIGAPIRATEIVVLDSSRRAVPPTVPGELAICGPGVARGYLGRPELTAQRFVKLWDGRRAFLTGDHGRERSDGTFEFLGRSDDQIKLGGYRIELQEIEQTLQSSPLVGEAAVKVHRSPSAAEQLIGYVTVDPSVRGGSESVSDEVMRFVQKCLPSFKRPRQIVLLDSLPKTSSGKVDRKRLPEPPWHSGGERPYRKPRTGLEQFLAEQWSADLSIERIGIDDDYFELGGSSLQAAMLASRLSDQLGLQVPTSLLFEMPNLVRTCERLAELHREEMIQRFGPESVEVYQDLECGRTVADRVNVHPLISDFGREEVSLQTASAPSANAEQVNAEQVDAEQAKVDQVVSPLFMVHPPGGIIICYRDLARYMARQRPFYAIRSRGLHGGEALPESVGAMASDYVNAVRATRPHGPYQLGGWSLGGVVAWEVARQLIEAGESVERLVLLDTAIPDGALGGASKSSEPSPGLEYGLDYSLKQLAELPPEEQLPLLWEHAKSLGVLDDDTTPEVAQRAVEDLKHLFHHHLNLMSRQPLKPLPVPVLLIRPREVPVTAGTSKDRGWSALSPKVRVEFVAGHHHSMVKAPGAIEIAKLIEEER